MLVQARDDATLYAEVVDLIPPWRKDPPTIVFCHGVATNCDIWSEWLPVLADRYRLVRFDLRGFGRSTIPGADFPWSLDVLADDILDVARAAGAQKFHVVGESMGGVACLHLAGRAGEDKLLSVTTCSSPFRGSELPGVRAWRTLLASGAVSEWSDTMMQQRFYAGELKSEIEQWFIAEQQRASPASLLGIGDVLLATDLSATLQRIQIPALLLAPDASPYVTVEIAGAMRRLIPNSELQIFPHARHGLPFSRGRKCAWALKAFLARHGCA